MSREYLMFGFLAVLWLMGLAGCGVALVAGRRGSRRWFWGTLLCALAGLAIGYLGVWTPLSLWPQISFSFTAGGSQWSIDCRWPFYAPLVLGALSLMLVIRRHFSPVPRKQGLAPKNSRLAPETKEPELEDQAAS